MQWKLAAPQIGFAMMQSDSGQLDARARNRGLNESQELDSPELALDESNS